MKTMKKAQGITLVGFLFGLCVLGIFLYAGMQIGPVYMDHQSILKVMRSEVDEGGNKSPGEIKNSLAKKLNISYITHVKPADFKVVRGKTRELQVKYEVEKEFFGNLSFIMRFEDSVTYY